MREKSRSELSGGSPEEIYCELIRKYGGYVYTIVMNRLNRVGTREDVEDCISSVFVDIYTSLDNISGGDSSIKSYIGRVADRRAVDAFRRLTYRQNNTAGADEELLSVPSDEDTEADTERKMMKKRLWEAVKALGSPDSDIIIMQYYYNIKTGDIAKRLGMTADAVRKRSLRARQKLNDILKG